MRLWLLRHAKSSWDNPALDDSDRPLAPRGERAADRMRGYLDAEGVRPALVLSSSAVRARQTLARVLPALGPDLEIRIEPRLYVFSADPLLDRLKDVPEGVASVMVVGHNPALHELALMLASRGDRLEDLARKLPTAALAEIRSPSDSWSELGEEPAELTRFVVPRELSSP